MPKRRAAKAPEINTASLCAAIQRSRLALRRPREERREMARQVVGRHWSEEGSDRDVIVNLLAMYQSIVGKTLIPHNPRLMLSTFTRRLKPAVSAMQSWSNKQIEHIHLANTLRRVVTDALYFIGIAKVALATPAESANAAWNLRPGEVMVSAVDLDDFVFDMHARDFAEVGFIGHRFRVPFRAIRDSKLYNRDARENLSPSTDQLYNQEGDERISAMGRTMYAADDPEYEPMVDLWEIYLPRDRLVVTLHEHQLSGVSAPNTGGWYGAEPLRIQSWIGPDRGPYHVLGFLQVPGNAMPKGPMQDLMDLHLESNRTYRKLRMTVDNLKELVFARNATDDGQRVMEASHMDVIPIVDPKNIGQNVIGGQSIQTLMAASEMWKNLFDFVGGNLSLLGGRAPQARTATQDKMLNQNANAGIADLQDQTTDFVSEVMKSTCWFWWHDPNKVMKTKHSLPGLQDMEFQRRVYPAGAQRPDGRPRLLQRNGPFEDVDINVDPYSLQHQSPQEKVAVLKDIVQSIVAPMLQVMTQQGKSFDVDGFLQQIAKLTNTPELGELINISEPPEQDEAPSLPDKPKMPAQTNREYTRHNVSEQTQRGNSQQLISRMLANGNMGGNPQTMAKNGQMAGIGS